MVDVVANLNFYSHKEVRNSSLIAEFLVLKLFKHSVTQLVCKFDPRPLSKEFFHSMNQGINTESSCMYTIKKNINYAI